MGLLRKKGLFDSGKVMFLPVEAILPNPEQPRRNFEPEQLEELARLLGSDNLSEAAITNAKEMRKQALSQKKKNA